MVGIHLPNNQKPTVLDLPLEKAKTIENPEQETKSAACEKLAKRIHLCVATIILEVLSLVVLALFFANCYQGILVVLTFILGPVILYFITMKAMFAYWITKEAKAIKRMRNVIYLGAFFSLSGFIGILIDGIYYRTQPFLIVFPILLAIQIYGGLLWHKIHVKMSKNEDYTELSLISAIRLRLIVVDA
ncbi:unnamed protein product, partial [Mesorhabditis belari]|uniref:Uncharacterized protein n=1 Tax=Mesorhabditis belari TaxID=2138241 RepID=A0AAF3F0S6_9BILA